MPDVPRDPRGNDGDDDDDDNAIMAEKKWRLMTLTSSHPVPPHPTRRKEGPKEGPKDRRAKASVGRAKGSDRLANKGHAAAAAVR